jgi:ABC-2 type transport system permease protein
MKHNQSLFYRGIALIKREYWENRKMITYSLLAMIGLICVFSLWAGINNPIDKTEVPDPLAAHSIVPFIAYNINIPLQVIMWVIMCLYLLGCLYNDRKDNSILFWQSLPISQTETVISKIIWACLVIPAITLVCMAINSIILMTIGVFIIHAPNDVWSISGIFLALMNFCRVYVYQLLIFLPTLGWCLFCSAFSKKLPLLWACLIPLGVQIADAIANKGYLNKHIFDPIYIALIKLNTIGSLINLPSSVKKEICNKHKSCLDLYNNHNTLSPSTIGLSWTFIATGALIGLAFIITAVYLRSRSYGKDI